MKEIVINDCKNRGLLTGSSMHAEITRKTGAAVLCRGIYVPEGTQPPEAPTLTRILVRGLTDVCCRGNSHCTCM